MDAGRAAAGGRPQVEDEFACAGMLRGSLTTLHATVERIFGVTLGIGVDDPPHGNNGQIWLKLRGAGSDVKAAKLFVKGVVNQEQQQEVSYPGVLHCVFCGARGLFMDCLIKSTSAHIVVGAPGFLLISGLAEPVVRAYSLVTELVERYEGTQPRRPEAEDRGDEALDSRRAFKAVVEQREDRHILDLLLLPASVKEILLDLVKESGLGAEPEDGEDRRDTGERPVEGRSHTASSPAGARGRAEGSEERSPRFPQEVGEEEQRGTFRTKEDDGPEGEEQLERQLSMGNKEFWLLLKFFTAMGYTEHVVKRVLARTGPKEASQILDLVQQEQDLSDREPALQGGRNPPCESEHREEEESVEVAMSGGGEAAGGGAAHSEEKEDRPEEDFVLGVLKKAAASCGYAEQNVAKFYNMSPDGSIHQLLLELQRDRVQETDVFGEGPREMDDVVLEKVEAGSEDGGWAEVSLPSDRQPAPAEQSDLFPWIHRRPPDPAPLPEVKGPPTSTYPPALDPPVDQSVYWPQASPSAQSRHPKLGSFLSVKHALQAPQPPLFTRDDVAPSVARERRGLPPASSSVVVTGEQRFLEGLQTLFDLQLTDQPGDAGLRTIIIDGSNVAMSHGLGHFFSCRGIALAVQHFWDRGHRHISALLPQWRQKSDARIKEQHYLTELQKLGLVSFTPSREVQGRRISSYDDRLERTPRQADPQMFNGNTFMLQLAQKTDGVIVTNDNLRDLSDETPVWRDIIKKRLLQYTFVGDHFMVPDDPLGRGGPHLDDFLRSEHRTPDPGNHSFAGVASAVPSSRVPRSQTEVLNFRDRTPGGGGRGKGRGQGRGWDAGRQHRQLQADRSPEDTASLRERLGHVFPGQDNVVTLVLQLHPAETDINVLSDLILEQQD